MQKDRLDISNKLRNGGPAVGNGDNDDPDDPEEEYYEKFKAKQQDLN